MTAAGSGAGGYARAWRHNAQAFPKNRECCKCCGADPLVCVIGVRKRFRRAAPYFNAYVLVCAGPTGPLFAPRQVLAPCGKPARGPAADQGVRPTIYAGILLPETASGKSDIIT